MSTTSDQIVFLLSVHDGDDRCGCLADLIRQLTSGEAIADEQVEERLRWCLQHHPSGSHAR